LGREPSRTGAATAAISSFFIAFSIGAHPQRGGALLSKVESENSNTGASAAISQPR
jgi:hypothetical protein